MRSCTAAHHNNCPVFARPGGRAWDRAGSAQLAGPGKLPLPCTAGLRDAVQEPEFRATGRPLADSRMVEPPCYDQGTFAAAHMGFPQGRTSPGFPSPETSTFAARLLQLGFVRGADVLRSVLSYGMSSTLQYTSRGFSGPPPMRSSSCASPTLLCHLLLPAWGELTSRAFPASTHVTTSMSVEGGVSRACHTGKNMNSLLVRPPSRPT